MLSDHMDGLFAIVPPPRDGEDRPVDALREQSVGNIDPGPVCNLFLIGVTEQLAKDRESLGSAEPCNGGKFVFHREL
jgi:hypothetical protein